MQKPRMREQRPLPDIPADVQQQIRRIVKESASHTPPIPRYEWPLWFRQMLEREYTR